MSAPVIAHLLLVARAPNTAAAHRPRRVLAWLRRLVGNGAVAVIDEWVAETFTQAFVVRCA
jgi:hypothetical protein